MSSDPRRQRRLRDIVVDCAHPANLARFWAAALRWPPPVWSDADLAELRSRGISDPEDDPVVFIASSDRALPRLCFQQVPEPKTAKNRVHLDVNVDSRQEVDELLAAGATLLAEHGGAGHGWVVLADPEGNEFCAVLS